MSVKFKESTQWYKFFNVETAIATAVYSKNMTKNIDKPPQVALNRPMSQGFFLPNFRKSPSHLKLRRGPREGQHGFHTWRFSLVYSL